jgi:hypothetical protein
MSNNFYPGSDQPVTTRLGLALYGMDEVLAENFILLDGDLVPGGLLPEFETNGTPNAAQNILNLIAGTNITLTSNGTGGVTIASTGGAGGFPKVVGTSVALTRQTTGVSGTLLASAPAGRYRVNFYAVATASTGLLGNLTPSVTYTDDSGATNSIQANTANLTSVGDNSNNNGPWIPTYFQHTGGDITYDSGYTLGTLTYSFYATLEQLN